MLIALYLLCVGFAALHLYRMWRGAIYVPMHKEAIQTVLSFAHITPGEKAVDLGAGDGRVVVALAKVGAHADGYEHGLLLTLIARLWIWRTGLSKRARVYQKDFWNVDLSQYDIIVVFGIEHIMGRLKEKIIREAKPEARIISNTFTFPEWQPLAQQGSVFLYKK